MSKIPPWATMTTADLRERAKGILAQRSYGPEMKDYTYKNINAIVELAIEFADCRWGINKLSEAIAEGLPQKSEPDPIDTTKALKISPEENGELHE